MCASSNSSKAPPQTHLARGPGHRPTRAGAPTLAPRQPRNPTASPLLPLLAGVLLAWAFASPLTAATPRAAKPATNSVRPLTLEELFGDPVIARGKNLEIKQSELNRAFLSYRSTLAKRGRQIPESQRTLKEAVLLDRMIVTHLLTNRATDMDRAVALQAAERFYTDSKKAAGSDEDFIRQLKVTGLTPAQYNQRIVEQAIADAVLDNELRSKITVTDPEITAFYQDGTDERTRTLQERLTQKQTTTGATEKEIKTLRDKVQLIRTSNLSRLESPEQARVQHVLVSTRQPKSDQPLPDDQKRQKRIQADALLKRAQAGEDFAQLVKKHSEDRRLEETGGEYTFSRDDPYAPEFKAAAFSLKPGQISDIVTTVFGYHIIKLLEFIPIKKVPLAEVHAEIKALLLQQKLQRQMPEYFDVIKREAKIQILDPKYQAFIPDEDDVEPALQPGLDSLRR